MDATVQVYAKSWVFEGTTEDEYHNTDDSSSVSMCSSSPAHANASETKTKSKNARSGRRISRTSDANSERFITQMSSFSRCATPSPVPRSGQNSPINGPNNHDFFNPLPVSGNMCSSSNGIIVAKPKANRLTVDYVSSPIPSPPVSVVKIVPKVQTVVASHSNGPPSISSQQSTGSQFASLLAELEQSLMDKKLSVDKDQTPSDSSLTVSDKYCSSKSSSKDLEFSKELEAALQLIQELETPSEGPADQPQSSSKFARSESEKTLSAAVSLPSPESVPFTVAASPADGPPTPHIGKHAKRNIIKIEPNSQSTSGYSSPNSFSSNVHSSSDKDYGYPVVKPQPTNKTTDQIFTSDLSNVVRIYIDPVGRTNTNNLLTKGHILSASNLLEASKNKPTDSLNNKSFSLFKRRSKLMPQPEFQSRILKSESLAYLSDEELVTRHRLNREAIRVRIFMINFFNSTSLIQFNNKNENQLPPKLTIDLTD